jgi:hypothetical protein
MSRLFGRLDLAARARRDPDHRLGVQRIALVLDLDLTCAALRRLPI